jgi:hypothetical protein
VDEKLSKIKVGAICQHPIGEAEMYGIEVEVEGVSATRHDLWFRGSNMPPGWGVVEDGSLRNGGAEFVSLPTPGDEVEVRVDGLYISTAKFWKPSSRTGIHIHANMQGRTFKELNQILSYYAYVEPLLFQFVGMEREQNIYCVPLYRAPREADMLREVMVSGRYSYLEESCKYSAIYAFPLMRYGTLEFRHAPTFTDPEHLKKWYRIVRAIANSYKLEDPHLVYAHGGVDAVAQVLFGDYAAIFGVGPDWLMRETTRVASDEIALRFSYPERQPSEWGRPGSFFVPKRELPDNEEDWEPFVSSASSRLDETPRLDRIRVGRTPRFTNDPNLIQSPAIEEVLREARERLRAQPLPSFDPPEVVEEDEPDTFDEYTEEEE